MKNNINKYWKIKRYILEEYSTEAKSRKKALENMNNGIQPHTITVLKETIVIDKFNDQNLR